MDHAATARRLYDLINAGDIDGFAGCTSTLFPVAGMPMKSPR